MVREFLTFFYTSTLNEGLNEQALVKSDQVISDGYEAFIGLNKLVTVVIKQPIGLYSKFEGQN